MNKKKKSTNTSPYPDEVIDRLARAFYPAILACWNSEEGQRSLVGARPLHLANARPFGRLKAPLGLSLLRCAAQTQACLWQAEQVHHAPSNEKQSVPDGERPVVHIAIVCGFLQGASGSRVPIKQYLQKFPKWGRFGVTSVTPFLLRPVHPKGCTPAHRT